MANSEILDVILLTALPGSGKSEVLAFLRSFPDEVRRDYFHVGYMVELDDFPYVDFMRDVDTVCGLLGLEPAFFQSADRQFKDPLQWGTLIHLLNQDFRLLFQEEFHVNSSFARYLFNRIFDAAMACRAQCALDKLPNDVLDFMCRLNFNKMGRTITLEEEADKLIRNRGRYHDLPSDLAGKTVFLEFSRGLPLGIDALPERGYGYSFSQLSQQILERASVFYIQVTPEESRRKNFERAPKPGQEDSTLFHMVPLSVMLGDYAKDDMEKLRQHWNANEQPDTVLVADHSKHVAPNYFLPCAVFDNRNDKTSFVRDKKHPWSPEDVNTLHNALRETFNTLWQAQSRR